MMWSAWKFSVRFFRRNQKISFYKEGFFAPIRKGASHQRWWGKPPLFGDYPPFGGLSPERWVTTPPLPYGKGWTVPRRAPHPWRGRRIPPQEVRLFPSSTKNHLFSSAMKLWMWRCWTVCPTSSPWFRRSSELGPSRPSNLKASSVFWRMLIRSLRERSLRFFPSKGIAIKAIPPRVWKRFATIEISFVWYITRRWSITIDPKLTVFMTWLFFAPFEAINIIFIFTINTITIYI